MIRHALFHYEACMIYHRKYKKKQEEKTAEKVFSAKTLHLIYGVQKEETEKEIEQAPAQAPVNNNHKNHQKNKNKQGRR